MANVKYREMYAITSKLLLVWVYRKWYKILQSFYQMQDQSTWKYSSTLKWKLFHWNLFIATLLLQKMYILRVWKVLGFNLPSPIETLNSFKLALIYFGPWDSYNLCNGVFRLKKQSATVINASHQLHAFILSHCLCPLWLAKVIALVLQYTIGNCSRNFLITIVLLTLTLWVKKGFYHMILIILQ